MRPTVEEQLQGTCRVLETIVAPCVSDPLALTILHNLIANLRMVTGALPDVAGFLRYDNDATQHLLLALRKQLPPELAASIDQAVAADEPDVGDTAAQDKRNGLLRAMLAQAVCCPDLSPDMRHAIESYMINRASRVPMRYVPTVAAATTSTARP